MERIAIIGSSGHAKVVIDVAEQMGIHRIVGLLDRFRQHGDTTLGYPVIGTEDDLPELVASHSLTGCFIAIGDNFVRGSVAAKVRALVPALPFVTLIHPSASVGRDASIGEGTVVMAGVAINSSTRIGHFCVVNTSASVDHDCEMDDFSSIGPGAHTGGNVRIGAYSAIGIGATVVHAVQIGEHTVIGAGSTVLHHVAPRRVAYGVPARVTRERQLGERYL